MPLKNSFLESKLALFFWIVFLIGISMSIGFITKPDLWYQNLNRSSLTPPNILFGPIWTFLYTLIGISGWYLWKHSLFYNQEKLKKLFIIQLILNWSWSPLFFYFKSPMLAFFTIISMIVIVSFIIVQAFKEIKIISCLLSPYLIWITFASYLNGYIWFFN